MAGPSHDMRAVAFSFELSGGQSRRQRQRVLPSAPSGRHSDLTLEAGSMKRSSPLRTVVAKRMVDVSHFHELHVEDPVTDWDRSWT